MSRLETSGCLILLYLFWEEVCERVRTSGDSTAYSRLNRHRCTNEVRDRTETTQTANRHTSDKTTHKPGKRHVYVRKLVNKPVEILAQWVRGGFEDGGDVVKQHAGFCELSVAIRANPHTRGPRKVG